MKYKDMLQAEEQRNKVEEQRNKVEEQRNKVEEGQYRSAWLVDQLLSLGINCEPFYLSEDLPNTGRVTLHYHTIGDLHGFAEAVKQCVVESPFHLKPPSLDQALLYRIAYAKGDVSVSLSFEGKERVFAVDFDINCEQVFLAWVRSEVKVCWYLPR